jgi:hypothetical protein
MVHQTLSVSGLSSKGRPRGFDREDALMKALTLSGPRATSPLQLLIYARRSVFVHRACMRPLAVRQSCLLKLHIFMNVCTGMTYGHGLKAGQIFLRQ